MQSCYRDYQKILKQPHKTKAEARIKEELLNIYGGIRLKYKLKYDKARIKKEEIKKKLGDMQCK